MDLIAGAFRSDEMIQNASSDIRLLWPFARLLLEERNISECITTLLECVYDGSFD